MTSDLPTRKAVEPNVLEHSNDCLCCLHFAVDFDAVPELVTGKRNSRRPKRTVATSGAPS